MRIGICVPARGQVEIFTSFDLSSLINYTSKKTKHDINLYTSTGTLIFDQRNALVDSVINERCDYLMFIDADMRFPKDALIRLLKHNKDIVGVNATTRSEPVKPTAKNIAYEEDGSVSWLPVYSNVKKGIEKVDAIGCGVILIKNSVFKKMEKPYFYFEQLPNGKLLGEDIYFCIKAKDAGIDTYVDHDLSLEIGHIGNYIYGWHNIEVS
jgi:hypothetical protein